MLKRVIRQQTIKRFCHTHSKTIFKENKKSVHDLLVEQNKQLDEANTMLLRIEDALIYLKYTVMWVGFCVIIKPSR